MACVLVIPIPSWTGSFPSEMTSIFFGFSYKHLEWQNFKTPKKPEKILVLKPQNFFVLFPWAKNFPEKPSRQSKDMGSKHNALWMEVWGH